MICPDTDYDCDNPGCRRGGCQGRRPEFPLLRVLTTALADKDDGRPEPGLVPQGAVAVAGIHAEANS